MNDGNRLFPIFLKLDKIQTLIVGGGNVALEKLEALLKNDPEANVHVVADEISNKIIANAETHRSVELVNRSVKKRDLRGIDLLILATNDNTLHVRIKKWSAKRNILTNIADTPYLCDFYLGSTVKKGDLKIGISTNGKSPTFAKRFRQVLEEILPDETSELLDNLKSIRDGLKGNFSNKVQRLNEITKNLIKNGSKQSDSRILYFD